MRGNTHTHTTYSDGDSPPEVVVDWYAEHGYDFVFLTDHNAMIPDGHLARIQGRGIAVWQGEELTMGLVHVNGLGLREMIVPRNTSGELAEGPTSDDHVERVQWAIERIEAQGAVATVNHPNRWQALGPDDWERLPGVRLFELANMSPEAALSNRGDESRPPTERLWDRLLTAGRVVWALASDDAHHFRTWGPGRANPGRGWLMVEAGQGRLADCLAALHDGRFYASTGLALADYRAAGREIAVELADGPAAIELVGSCGRVLERVEGVSARFALAPGSSPYARVRATGPDGAQLWTQPHFQ